MPIWNPWHGCHKISLGCANCYVHWRDENVDRDANINILLLLRCQNFSDRNMISFFKATSTTGCDV